MQTAADTQCTGPIIDVTELTESLSRPASTSTCTHTRATSTRSAHLKSERHTRPASAATVRRSAPLARAARASLGPASRHRAGPSVPPCAVAAHRRRRRTRRLRSRRCRRCRRAARQKRPGTRRGHLCEKVRPSVEGRTDGPVAAGRARGRSHLPSGHARAPATPLLVGRHRQVRKVLRPA